MTVDEFCPCRVAGANECSATIRRCACIRLSPNAPSGRQVWAATDDEACLHPIHAAIRAAIDEAEHRGVLRGVHR